MTTLRPQYLNTLYLVRGVPGAGKTDFVEKLLLTLPHSVCFAADDYFYNNFHVYVYDASKIRQANQECFANTFDAINNEMEHVFVTNTFIRASEMEEYYKLATTNGYRVVSLIVENRHGNQSVHAVPTETVIKMKNRFNVKL